MIGTPAGLVIGLIDEVLNPLRHTRPVSGGVGGMFPGHSALFGACWGLGVTYRVPQLGNAELCCCGRILPYELGLINPVPTKTL